MFKRMLCLLLMAALLPVLPVFAEESSADTLSFDELCLWAEGFKTRALATRPLNDPTAPEAQTEDGYMFVYSFATLYMDSPKMTQDSQVQGVVVYSAEEEGPRGTRVDYTAQEIMDAFYNENNQVTGSRDKAVLYAVNLMPAALQLGLVHRDGQRIQTIEYVVHEQLATGGEGYTDAGLIYTVENNNVSAIRAYGLEGRVDEENVLASLQEAHALSENPSYGQVEISYVGTDLKAFNLDDLMFASLDFPTLTPEDALGVLGIPNEDSWLDNTDGFIRVMEFPHCEITFLYDEDKLHPQVDSLVINSDGMEGPRSVRIGDSFSSVLNRFRHSEGDYEDGAELLYGSEESGEYGVAQYGSDASATLRYSTKTEAGTEMAIYMYFHQMSLSEILIYVNR